MSAGLLVLSIFVINGIVNNNCVLRCLGIGVAVVWSIPVYGLGDIWRSEQCTHWPKWTVIWLTFENTRCSCSCRDWKVAATLTNQMTMGAGCFKHYSAKIFSSLLYVPSRIKLSCPLVVSRQSVLSLQSGGGSLTGPERGRMGRNRGQLLTTWIPERKERELSKSFWYTFERYN